MIFAVRIFGMGTTRMKLSKASAPKSSEKMATKQSGYEFQFSPSNVSVGDLANWVVAESKCCPFVDFHIDLEEGGRLLCLRFTGEEGIKEFIRSEFKVSAT